MSPQALLVGIAAGLASGLLFAGLVLGSSTAVGLAFVAPIPVAIASLGWGTVSGFVAAFTAAGLLYAATSAGMNALALLLTMTLPTAVAGHLAGLARPAEAPAASVVAPPGSAGAAPRLDWYPLPRIFHALVGMAIGACVVIGWLVGYEPAAVGADLAAALNENGAAVDGLSPEQVAQLTRFLADLVPLVQPAVLVTTLVVGLYLGALVTRISGRLPRPRDDVPTAGRLPRVAVTFLALGLAAAFLPGAAGLVGGVVAGAYFAAFSLVGLASLHRRTRGRTGRGLMLFAAYGAVVLLGFPIVAFTVLGIVETGRQPLPSAPPRA